MLSVCISSYVWMHLGGLESTQEARVALGYRFEQLIRFLRALQTSRVHPQLDMRTLSMNQFLIFGHQVNAKVISSIFEFSSRCARLKYMTWHARA